MKKLPDEVKLFIVRALAKYKMPTQIVELVKGEFGVEITPQHVRIYNPEQCEVSPRWTKIFRTTRTDFHKKIEDIPIANLATRVEWLNDIARRAQRNGHGVLERDAMRQAAEDLGGAYTNRRHISGELKGGVLAVPVTVDEKEYLTTVAAQQAALPGKAKAAAEQATATGARK